MLNRRLHFGRTSTDPTCADRLTQGDNLPLLEATPDATVDLVYVDPPFATGTRRHGRVDAEPTSWQDVPNDPERFVDWLSPRLAHCRRVLQPHGSLFVHLDYRTVHYIKVALDRLFGRSRLVNEIVWCYSVGGKSQRSFARKHDTILWYGRSPDYAFYPDAVRVPRRAGSHMRVTFTEDGRPVQEKTDRRTGKVYRYPVAAGKVPEDWWTDIETLNRGDRERTGWATQKPERLLTRIVASASAPGDLVADWFCGAATTAVVAQQLDRRFVAADVAPAAIRCAARRLEQSGLTLAANGTPPRDLIIETTNAEAAAPTDHVAAHPTEDATGTGTGTIAG